MSIDRDNTNEDITFAEVDLDDLLLKQGDLQRDLLLFVREFWHIIEPDREFVCNWHIVELCQILQDITAGKHNRAIINVPPGTMKSLLVSVFWPCWMWAKNPRLKILTAAYSRDRAFDANLQARKLFRSEAFQQAFPGKVKLKSDQDEKGRFDSVAGGWRIATSVEGEGTGLHPDIIIIDDASTATDAESPVARLAVINWFNGTVSTRGVSRDVKILVIGQRLHEEDLPGYLLGKDRVGWLLVCWPMRYEKARPATDSDPGYTPDPLDPRTEEGQLLWPELFTEAKVRQLEIDLGEYGTSGQLQQRPAPVGGGLFKLEWFAGKMVDKAPEIMSLMRGWDTAASEGKGDRTAGCKIGREFAWKIENGKRQLLETGRIFILDMKIAQLGPDGVDKLIKATAELDGKVCPVREEREGGASGKAQIASRTKLLAGWDYAEVQLGTNKRVRAKPLRSQCEGGYVYIVNDKGVGGLDGTGWNRDFINELCSFPTGAHDDQVDAASCAYNAVLLEPPPRKVELTW